HLKLAAAVILPAAALLTLLARPLDVLSLGDEEAASLGLHVHAARLLFLGLAALLTGAATAVAGAVPFVGLVAPHALRPLVGPRRRFGHTGRRGWQPAHRARARGRRALSAHRPLPSPGRGRSPRGRPGAGSDGHRGAGGAAGGNAIGGRAATGGRGARSGPGA